MRAAACSDSGSSVKLKSVVSALPIIEAAMANVERNVVEELGDGRGADAVIKMIDMIAAREGFGDTLAEGIAVLQAEKIYTTFSEAIEAEDWAQKMPTNVVLISGPSKTADIELTLAFGVHGPKELIVLILHENR